ncbi:sterol carrier family protein [Nesterenkonia sp. NBAIMH1]|uniref:sterol carrier family protein n=1 Tax=Nesterenkonia sp. NBAIMH1 TaxID=2600320 RepID=UPI0011B794F1|nr:sterol carrier family protein [Nesterenkonia sp. NBAIMH1]
MARRRISAAEGSAAARSWAQAQEAGAATDRRTLATAVRYLLEELAERAPGSSVEVRVPPFGVAQCVEGPSHTRGTPPNVVEMSPQTWMELATGLSTWQEAYAAGGISASGTRADLSGLVPLI